MLDYFDRMDIAEELDIQTYLDFENGEIEETDRGESSSINEE